MGHHPIRLWKINQTCKSSTEHNLELNPDFLSPNCASIVAYLPSESWIMIREKYGLWKLLRQSFPLNYLCVCIYACMCIFTHVQREKENYMLSLQLF